MFTQIQSQKQQSVSYLYHHDVLYKIGGHNFNIGLKIQEKNTTERDPSNLECVQAGPNQQKQHLTSKLQYSSLRNK